MDISRGDWVVFEDEFGIDQIGCVIDVTEYDLCIDAGGIGLYWRHRDGIRPYRSLNLA